MQGGPVRPAWLSQPNTGNRPPARWPLASAGADAAQPWPGWLSLRAEEQTDGVRRKPWDPHPSPPGGNSGPLLSLLGRGEVTFHPVQLSHREACRAQPGDSVSCRNSCRSSRGGFRRGSGGREPSGQREPPQKARPPTLEHRLWAAACSAVRHAWGSSRAQGGAGSEGVLRAGGLGGSPRPAHSTWATGFVYLRTCGREHVLALQDVGVSRLHGDDKGVYADSRPSRVSSSRARWGSWHRVRTPQ